MRRPSGRPRRAAVAGGWVVGEARLVGAVGVHRVYRVVSVPGGLERDAPTVGRPRLAAVGGGMVGETDDAGAVGVHRVYFPIAVSVGDERDAPVGRLRQRRRLAERRRAAKRGEEREQRRERHDAERQARKGAVKYSGRMGEAGGGFAGSAPREGDGGKEGIRAGNARRGRARVRPPPD